MHDGWKPGPTVTRDGERAYIAHSPRTLKLYATSGAVVVELYQLGEAGGALHFMIGAGGSDDNDRAEMDALRAVVAQATSFRPHTGACAFSDHAGCECDAGGCGCLCHRPCVD
jgi:hypothetical protein